MLKLLRYTLAAIFIAASVGCLGLLWRSLSCSDTVSVPSSRLGMDGIDFDFRGGMAELSSYVYLSPPPSGGGVEVKSHKLPDDLQEPARRDDLRGFFGDTDGSIYFPLWYPALVFALAAVGVLRLGKAFTIRSALLATTVVAVLLGMVVAL